MALNPAQARAVRATFIHVSDLLDGVVKIAREDLSAFDRTRPDLSRAEAEELVSLASSIRSRMLEALTQLGLAPPEPETSARWSVRTSLLYSRIALSEMSGAALRAYGDLDPEDERRLVLVAEELKRRVQQAEDLLRRPE